MGKFLYWPIRGGSAQKGYVFRLQIYQGVGNSQIEVYDLGLGRALTKRRSTHVMNQALQSSTLEPLWSDSRFRFTVIQDACEQFSMRNYAF